MLFGKFTLLTSVGIDIGNDWNVVNFEKPIKAINNGASIVIQLPPGGEILQSIDTEGNVFKQLEKIIPPGTISARIINKEASVLLVSHNFSISDFSLKKEDSVRIHLRGNILPNVAYDSVKIKSTIPLKNVMIGWKNYDK